MSKVIEVWADTGVIVERDYTVEENNQREIDAEALAQATVVKEARNLAIANAKAKLAELGLTTEDLQALGL